MTVCYRKIVNNNDREKFQIDLARLGKQVVENVMTINPCKSKAVSFTRAWVKDLINYSLRDQGIPEASSMILKLCHESGCMPRSKPTPV
jgi:hypothetical protein